MVLANHEHRSNLLPEEQLADKTPAELLTIVKERVETIHTNLVETTQENLLMTIQQIVPDSASKNSAKAIAIFA